MAPNQIVYAVRNPLKIPTVRFNRDKTPKECEVSIPKLAEMFNIPTWKAKEVAFVLREDVKMNFLEDDVDHTVVISYDPETKSLIYSWAKVNVWVDKFSRSFGTKVATERSENIKSGKYPIVADVKTVDHLRYILPKTVYSNFMYYVDRGYKYFHDQKIERIKVYAKIYDPTEEETHSFVLDINPTDLGI